MTRGILPLLYVDLARKPVSVVLAQDAAAPEEKLYGADRRRVGAFALAAMVPPPAEIKAVLANIQLVGSGQCSSDGDRRRKSSAGIGARPPTTTTHYAATILVRGRRAFVAHTIGTAVAAVH